MYDNPVNTSAPGVFHDTYDGRDWHYMKFKTKQKLFAGGWTYPLANFTRPLLITLPRAVFVLFSLRANKLEKV